MQILFYSCCQLIQTNVAVIMCAKKYNWPLSPKDTQIANPCFLHVFVLVFFCIYNFFFFVGHFQRATYLIIIWTVTTQCRMSSWSVGCLSVCRVVCSTLFDNVAVTIATTDVNVVVACWGSCGCNRCLYTCCCVLLQSRVCYTHSS